MAKSMWTLVYHYCFLLLKLRVEDTIVEERNEIWDRILPGIQTPLAIYDTLISLKISKHNLNYFEILYFTYQPSCTRTNSKEKII